ncbi:MAG: bacillithiol system redox-active protein YtxJ [Flavobacteriaceae bacterium]|nr:bacillithiol system redox-active protein YtxJ [Flavobacteriaceae bacterium]MDG1064094.1 bacillithiol system redox-active protein YtxJ [Flavobacteriaceae bacterium]MDG1961773.1 bacillithiol system redox-active protein YtxJ [Flavobacteriaceae bacterium]
MSIFNFGRKSSPKTETGWSDGGFPWQPLHTEFAVDQARTASNESYVFLFKHSTRCIISKMVLRDLEAHAAALSPLGQWYFNDLIADRHVSNHIAQSLSVRHESPQLIILRDQKVFWNGAHQGVSADQVINLLRH